MTADPNTWWPGLDPEYRDQLNRLARDSILELDCYPYSNAEVAAELVAWTRLEADIAEAHGDWLDFLRPRTHFDPRSEEPSAPEPFGKCLNRKGVDNDS
jgi:hypothetical protein